jgi:hypothetical protein
MSMTSTVRCTLWRGVRHSRTLTIAPNSPYPPMAARNTSEFSALLHLRTTPSGPTIVKATTSPMKGGSLSPRPCTFAASAPPMLSLSAPVCFWMNAHGLFSFTWLSILVKLGPLNTGLDFDLTADAIELDDSRQSVHINQRSVRRELLATHSVSAASNAHCSPTAECRANYGLHCINRFGPNDVTHSRRIQV